VSARRLLWIVCALAALHGLFYVWYQRPDWTTQWSDQDGYRRLGQVLADTGKFTRYPDAPRFVPEVIRTPVYPAFVAVVYRLFGTGQVPVALAQTGLFVVICLLVFAIAREAADDDTIAVGAAAATALYVPIPYFGALVMTEVWTTFVFTVSMLFAVRALRSPSLSRLTALGILCGLTALSRPAFVLFPVALAALWTIAYPAIGIRPRPRPVLVVTMLVAFAITMAPWFAYNYVNLGRLTLSPAGGIGRGLWEGSWQAVWTGRLQNELTQLADATDDRAELDRRVAAIAAREHLAPNPMLAYVHQWQDIRRIWTTPEDPYARALARAEADREYERVALDNLRHDRPAHLAKRLARGIFVLWAGEIPVRYSQINALPPMAIYLCWAFQAVVFALALAGIVVLAGRGHAAQAGMLALPIAYVTAVHFPLLTEARQSLPAQPVVVLLAAVAVYHLLGTRAISGSVIYSRSRSANNRISPYT